ncbi:DUF1707 domain-containing protein [Streptomyces sp. NPDC049954]|uniref:DUF1707 SHOCT-like domain-containing protein n=1 Tax=Streptomyces sp. NPDC049954 TaxID=3155779 RepID=UPI003449D7B1
MDLEKRPQPPATTAPPAQAPPALRASDADRDRFSDILREALAEGRLTAEEHGERVDAVYRAKTLAELEPLVSDLPRAGHPAAGPMPRQAPAGYAGAEENLVAVLSSSTRKGRWRVPARISAYSVFGNIEIDLSEALFEHQQVVVHAVSVFGNVEVRVPENVSLRGSGSGILGNFEVDTLESRDPGAPVVHIQGFAVLGNIEAKPKRGRIVRDLTRHLRKHLGH